MKELCSKYRLEIIAVTIMIVVGTCMHFVCDLVDNESAMKVLGIIFPVNETSWEHMKMIWYPFLGAGIILSVIKKNKGCFGGFVISGTAAMLIIIGLFAFYQSFTTTSVLALDIPLFIIVFILCSMLAFLLAKQEWCKKSMIVWVICAILITGLIIYLTYQPGPGYLFLDDTGLE
jgi:hypothetical protein